MRSPAADEHDDGDPRDELLTAVVSVVVAAQPQVMHVVGHAHDVAAPEYAQGLLGHHHVHEPDSRSRHSCQAGRGGDKQCSGRLTTTFALHTRRRVHSAIIIIYHHGADGGRPGRLYG